MAKYTLKYRDVSESNLTIEVVSGVLQKCVLISLRDEQDSDNYFDIYLDESTAIKFAKTLRTEINKIKEVGNE